MQRRVPQLVENKIVELESELRREKVLNVMRQDKHEKFAQRDNIVIAGIMEKSQGEERQTLIKHSDCG